MGSLLFGGGEPAPAPRSRVSHEIPSAAPMKQEAPLVEKPINVPAPTSTMPIKTSSNMYASGANQNSGNFITDRPTSKLYIYTIIII